MGFKTTKIGDTCKIKETGETSTVESIERGAYKIKGIPGTYRAHELLTIASRPEQKKQVAHIARKTRPKKVSADQSFWNSIYSIIAPKFKIDHPDCEADLPGCTHKTEEIHHKYKRSKIWLIMSAYFLGVCRSCHRIITDDSAMAIEMEFTIPKSVDLPEVISEYEQKIIDTMSK